MAEVARLIMLTRHEGMAIGVVEASAVEAEVAAEGLVAVVVVAAAEVDVMVVVIAGKEAQATAVTVLREAAMVDTAGEVMAAPVGVAAIHLLVMAIQAAAAIDWYED